MPGTVDHRLGGVAEHLVDLAVVGHLGGLAELPGDGHLPGVAGVTVVGTAGGHADEEQGEGAEEYYDATHGPT